MVHVAVCILGFRYVTSHCTRSTHQAIGGYQLCTFKETDRIHSSQIIESSHHIHIIREIRWQSAIVAVYDTENHKETMRTLIDELSGGNVSGLLSSVLTEEEQLNLSKVRSICDSVIAFVDDYGNKQYNRLHHFFRFLHCGVLVSVLIMSRCISTHGNLTRDTVD